MTQYIESIVGDRGQILIEVDDPSGNVGFGARSAIHEERAHNAFNQALNTIQLAASSILETLDTLEERPDTARIDFAIKFDPEARAMLAKSAGNAQLRVTLSWTTAKADQEEK